MKLKYLFAGILLSIFISAGPASASFSSLVSFGDSLSDNGDGDGFGYGRYTDSYASIWVETLALINGGASLYDYAYGGATTGLENLVTPDSTGLTSQVTDSDILADIVSQGLDYSDTLFTIWAGGNDIRYGTNPYTAAANIINALSSLAGIGAEYFLVPNLPDPAMTPSIYYNTEYTAEEKQMISVWADIFNNTLLAGLTAFADANSDVSVYFLDVETIFNEFSPGDTSWELLFWDYDGYHPSFTGHTLIAQAAAGVLAGDPIPSSVPVPGAAVLMASGLMVLVRVRRR